MTAPSSSDFERRLASSVRALARRGATAGLAGLALSCGDGKLLGPSDEEICAGDLPEGWTEGEVYLTVELGAPCPDTPTVSEVHHPSCCTPEVTEVVCAFRRKDANQDDTTYGFEPSNDPEVDVCWYSAAFSRSEGYACCGRPLVQGGRATTAAPRAAPRPRHAAHRAGARAPSDAVRARVGAFWLRTALAEHASIASFAKFSLDLVRLGAPPALLAAASQAAVDEAVHTEQAFAIANAALGARLSAGPLPVEAPASTTAEVAVALVHEGCVGETLAALDAAERLAHAQAPAVRRALRRVVADESRHAALAWRALRWLVEQHPDLLATVRATFTDARRRLESAPTEVPAEGAEARSFGLPDDATQRRTFLEGWDRVIAPSAARLRVPRDRPTRRA